MATAAEVPAPDPRLRPKRKIPGGIKEKLQSAFPAFKGLRPSAVQTTGKETKTEAVLIPTPPPKPYRDGSRNGSRN